MRHRVFITSVEARSAPKLISLSVEREVVSNATEHAAGQYVCDSLTGEEVDNGTPPLAHPAKRDDIVYVSLKEPLFELG